MSIEPLSRSMRGESGDCSPVVGDGGDDSWDGVEKGVLDDSWDDTMPGWVTIPGLCGSLGSSTLQTGMNSTALKIH